MAFKEYEAKEWHEILPQGSAPGRDLVSKLIRYESSQRMPANEVCILLYRTVS